MENKSLVFSTGKSHLAAVIKGELEANGIAVTVLDHNDSAFNVMNQIDLFVDPENEQKAKQIIAESNA
ncbi:putative signal transducing protein [Crocinitomix algicola]|uniref:putative signal transducing protein n=1 Tax=Crocinitomix algicola TaxID=1740263 RepID=UPI00082D963B|nr:DUF2007 domain-containing protein [Crocinitomix algicola]